MKKNFVRTGLIGHPVSHSKSPLIHNYWIKRHNLEGLYAAVDLPCETLEEGIASLVAQGFCGFNVTVPHKVDVMKHCHQIDNLAKRVGAVNTVVIQDKKLFGTNTDVFGFVQNIKENAPKDFDFKNGDALVLGAGGASRAVVQGLLDEGVPKILIANRTRSNADILLAHVSDPSRIKIVPWEDKANKDICGQANLLVNTTSLGMTGKAVLKMDLSHLPEKCLVNDIVYAPLMTGLLEAAKKRGNPVVTGIGMLLHQARPAFEKWYGIMPAVTPELEKMVLS